MTSGVPFNTKHQAVDTTAYTQESSFLSSTEGPLFYRHRHSDGSGNRTDVPECGQCFEIFGAVEPQCIKKKLGVSRADLVAEKPVYILSGPAWL